MCVSTYFFCLCVLSTGPTDIEKYYNSSYKYLWFYNFSYQKKFWTIQMWLVLNVNATSGGPLDMAQIGVAPPPSLSSVCQMAGGFVSPDIHQCLAVRCSHSSDLTCRLVQQNSFPLLSAARTSPNDAAKWSSVSREPNNNAAKMALRSNTDVQLSGLQPNLYNLFISETVCMKPIVKYKIFLVDLVKSVKHSHGSPNTPLKEHTHNTQEKNTHNHLTKCFSLASLEW